MPSDQDSRDDGPRRPPGQPPGRPPEQPLGGRFEETWFESPPPGESRRSPLRDSDAGADLYAPPDDDDNAFRAPPPASAPRQQRSRTLPVIIALLALAGFAGLLWYAYAWGVGGADSGQLPVVAAESSPAKVAPEEPGGMEIPNQDKRVLNQSEGGEVAEVERLLPPPEEPNPPEVSSDPAPALPSEETQAAGNAAQDGAGEDGAAEDGQGQGGQGQAGPVETEEAQPAPEVPQTETAPPPELSAEPEAGQASEPETQTAQASDAPEPPQLTEPPPDSYVMQLAAVRSEDTARAEWARMQGEHEQLLGDMPLFVQQVELEGKGTYFRIQTGPFPSRSTAQDLCAQLKTAGQDCLVTQR